MVVICTVKRCIKAGFNKILDLRQFLEGSLISLLPRHLLNTPQNILLTNLLLSNIKLQVSDKKETPYSIILLFSHRIPTPQLSIHFYLVVHAFDWLHRFSQSFCSCTDNTDLCHHSHDTVRYSTKKKLTRVGLITNRLIE